MGLFLAKLDIFSLGFGGGERVVSADPQRSCVEQPSLAWGRVRFSPEIPRGRGWCRGDVHCDEGFDFSDVVFGVLFFFDILPPGVEGDAG